MGKNMNTFDTLKAGIEAAGFTNCQEKLYKAPFGDWPKNPLMKEVGRYQKRQILDGLEGYAMYAPTLCGFWFILTLLRFMLTKFGEPEPWSPEEVQVFLAKTRKEFADPKLHCYVYKRRVWVCLQFPFLVTRPVSY